MATLLVLTGAQQGQRLTLLGNRTVLGRLGDCDVVITESMLGANPSPKRIERIGRHHATIARIEGKYFIEDGDGQGKPSRNGTFVNDQQVPFPGQHRLRHNDRIRICDFVCTFHDAASPSFIAPPLPSDVASDDDCKDGSSVEAVLDQESSSHLWQTQPADKLRVILDISNGLSKTLDSDVLLPQIVNALFKLFKQADRGFIILWDDAVQAPSAHVFKTRQAGPNPDSRFSASVVMRCLSTGEAILANDLKGTFPGIESVSGLPIRTLMCVPLRAGRPAARGDPARHGGRQEEVHGGRPEPAGRRGQPGFGGFMQRPVVPGRAGEPAPRARPGAGAPGAAGFAAAAGARRSRL